MKSPVFALPWLAPGENFPDPTRAWDLSDPVPGLLAGGGVLDTPTLKRAYSSAIFPWFSDDQPVLWWSPDPRMVLKTADFRLHRSLRKTISRFMLDDRCEVRFDSNFAKVIRACATGARPGQAGTWIVASMVRAYEEFHRAGYAHSIETWIDGELAGGLYCVAIGKAVFGESMFTRSPDASKIALAALVSFCRYNGISTIDCQQNTRHLASLGAHEIARAHFVEQVSLDVQRPGPEWKFKPVYWNELVKPTPA
ncbi:leucyl/phenylalanyl-tRNA--protein transferase [soil metagenome]